MSNTMRVLKNDGAGSFTGTTYCLTPYEKADGNWKNYWTSSIRMADMNGDGFADIVTGEWSNYGEDRVVFNNGDGTFNIARARQLRQIITHKYKVLYFWPSLWQQEC